MDDPLGAVFRKKCHLILLLIVIATTAHAQNITCAVPSDVVFVLDGSESLSEVNFSNMKTFVLELLSKFQVSYAFTRVGVIVYGTIPGDIVYLGSVNYLQVLEITIRNLNQPKSGTGTPKAIERMRRMFNERGRSGVDKVGIVITDGRSVSPEQTKQQADLAKSAGISIISIGFGSNVFRTELEQIASSSSLVFESNDFNMLLSEVEVAMRSLICHVITTTITTTTTTTTTTTPAPTTQAPTTQAPTTLAPTTQAPTTPAPTTRAPTTQAPTTQAPITQAPTTQAPTTPQPMTQAQTTRRPITPIPTLPPTGSLLSTVISDLCPNCIIGRNWGYRPYPGDCTRYISMFPDGRGGRVSSVQKCPFGSWWDSYSVSCRYPVDVSCTDDPCRGVSYGAFPMEDVCSGFWFCINGKAYPSCCPKQNQRFLGNGPQLNCSDTPFCPDSCPPADLNRLVGTIVCASYPHPSDRTKYLEYAPGSGNITRDCATGTYFISNDCACTGIDNLASLPLQTCNPQVYLNFDDNFSDLSGNEIAAGLENVALDTKEAKFSGDGMINMWRFSNSDFRQTLVITFMFRPENVGTPGPIQALVTNCVFSDQEEASVAISVVPGSAPSVLYFKTETTRGAAEVFVPYDPSIMSSVVYIYDGVTLTGRVNNEVRSTPLTGDILRRQSGIVIGAGSKMANYRGHLDEFKLYTCFPSGTNGRR
ncbi:collagen alpha-1(XXVIII) chain-like [Ylistrum balloti]|uniref:collagen alpha-1(XXVIII) chain-like n=1 Tax=Ylistrum balloti TaxID=509963 RepID=UPI002905D467|nr:collagen alpha-1(XXVIII) chain-like [Ylistrum balloti]